MAFARFSVSARLRSWAMKRARVLTLVVSAVLVVGLALAVRSGAMPLGVRGEWEWSRLPNAPLAVDVVVAGVGVAGYALFAALGMVALGKDPGRGRETLLVGLLMVASIVAQGVAHAGAPAGYGLAKWAPALFDPGASGYFTVARQVAHDPPKFLARYPEWVRRQDSLHLGTHPPGLIIVDAYLLRTMEGSPRLVRFVLANLPESIVLMFRTYGIDNPMSPADRASLATIGFFTLLICGATVVPLYGLARVNLSASAAWSTAALWPLVPSAILFQPAADAAFPFFATLALALAAKAGGAGSSRRRSALALGAGLVLGLGMQFSLVFLPVGLIVALLLLSGDRASITLRDRLSATLATGLGFLIVTVLVWGLSRANPFVIWWWNQINHARFYAEFSRNYRAWVVVNPIELAVALGLPVTVWGSFALFWPRDLPRVSLATAAVLAFLTLGGRNLSEVGRLWLPFMPALIVSAGFTMSRMGAGPKSLAATIGLIGAETLALEAMIQVMYPV